MTYEQVLVKTMNLVVAWCSRENLHTGFNKKHSGRCSTECVVFYSNKCILWTYSAYESYVGGSTSFT